MQTMVMMVSMRGFNSKYLSLKVQLVNFWAEICQSPYVAIDSDGMTPHEISTILTTIDAAQPKYPEIVSPYKSIGVFSIHFPLSSVQHHLPHSSIMRSFTFLASLVVALPSVLAAVVPTSNNIGRALTAPDADVDVAARLTSSSEALTRRQAEAEPLTLEDINQVIEECKSQGSGGSMVRFSGSV